MRHKTLFFLVFFIFLAGCFIPADFVLSINAPSLDRIGWDFDGKWQFAFLGYDPRKSELKPEDRAMIGKALDEIPGAKPAAFLGKNVWSQSIHWEGALSESSVTFPTADRPAEMWLVRVRRADAKTIEIETSEVAKSPDRAALTDAGYTAEGEFRIKTPGTLQQLSGPTLTKSWFSSAYSAKFNFLKDQRIVVRVAF